MIDRLAPSLWFALAPSAYGEAPPAPPPELRADEICRGVFRLRRRLQARAGFPSCTDPN